MDEAQGISLFFCHTEVSGQLKSSQVSFTSLLQHELLVEAREKESCRETLKQKNVIQGKTELALTISLIESESFELTLKCVEGVWLLYWKYKIVPQAPIPILFLKFLIILTLKSV